ncbi:MAG: hypothetical protein VX938_07905, partial [Myxococcota bacterium]|nr:hypothetical protein [Myxococcota bacterium]
MDTTTPPVGPPSDVIAPPSGDAAVQSDAGPGEEDIVEPPVVELGPAGKWCAAGGVIDAAGLPFTVEGDTTDGESQVEPDGCGSSIGSAPDAVWTFTPDTTAYYTI